MNWLGAMLMRVISTAVMVPVLLAAAFWPDGWVFTVLVGALSIQGLREFYAGCRKMGAVPASAFGYAGVVMLLVCAVPLFDPVGAQAPAALFPGPRSSRFFLYGFTLLIVFSLLGQLARGGAAHSGEARTPARDLGATWLGILYIGWLFPFLARLRWLGPADLLRVGWPTMPQPFWTSHLDPGSWVICFLLLLNWTTDTAAYLVGKPLGRHKLAPTLSPGKSWEGSAGGFLGCLVVAWAAGRLLAFPLGFSLAAGALVGIAAQLGDLCKSALKREMGLKDFGAIIPGHGGVLDRFDSLMFTGTALYLLWAVWLGG